MKITKFLGLGLMVAGLSAFGCGKSADTPKTDSKPGDKVAQKGDEHDHGEGPHGGTVIELGKYHGEFVVDHAKKQATVYILDVKLKNAVPLATPKLLLSIKQPTFQTDLVAAPQDGDPMGKASRFIATHDNFGKEQEFAGTVSGEIDGKPYLGDFQEEAHADHDHDKKHDKK